jgi:uncharacterized membrane protein
MEGHEHLEFTPDFTPWLVVAIIAALAVVGVVLWFRWARRSPVSATPEKPAEKPAAPKAEELEVKYGENVAIFDMLRQKGGPMSQTEISEQIGIGAEPISRVLIDMEAIGMIERRWDAAKKTFMVTLREW